MKKITKFLLGATLIAAAGMNTGCIKETFPTNAATDDVLASSPKAAEALLWAMPAFLNNYQTNSSNAYDWGYGSIMHIRDVMTEDMSVVTSGYDWYTSWATNTYMGESYAYGQYIWNYYWKLVQTTNNVIGAIDPESASEAQLGYMGAAHAYRAMAYLDLARMFEFLENDVTSRYNEAGNDVLHLTVPIVTESITEAEARENPRATREEMAGFILDDLKQAEELIEFFTEKSRTQPHIYSIYGLYARLYMWLEQYENAATYARKAIDSALKEDNIKPMTETECLSKTAGFNDLSCWMWGSQMMSEDDVVQSGILNWTSWMSNETSFGYASAGPYVMIGKSTYDRISDTDFRKLMWKAPGGSTLDGQNPWIDAKFAEDLPDYASLKFRPASGEMDDYNVGAASAYPLMRVEEMYLIEAEAVAHSNPAQGRQLLESFMALRDDSYTFMAADVVEEIVFQKRVELWGEGQSFYDIKRLNYSVTRAYEDTNFDEDRTFNTKGRPGWMNFCIVQTEKNNNRALVGFENPDPSGLYTPIVSE